MPSKVTRSRPFRFRRPTAILATAALALLCAQARDAQAQLSDAEMARHLGLTPGESIDFHPVGVPTRFTKRYTLDLDSPEAIDIARSARGNLSEVVTYLFGQRQPPAMRLHTRLDPRLAGSSREVVAAFNDRVDVHGRKPPRELPLNTVLTFLVDSAVFGVSTDTYPYADEEMERDCHRRLCMIVAVDLADPAHLGTALSQLKRVSAEWARLDWSPALTPRGQDYHEARTMTAYQRMLTYGMEVLPASNPGTYSAVLGSVVRPAGGGVLGSFVAVGFVGENSTSP